MSLTSPYCHDAANRRSKPETLMELSVPDPRKLKEVEVARKTIFVSDLTGETIDEKDAATVTIKYADAPPDEPGALHPHPHLR